MRGGFLVIPVLVLGLAACATAPETRTQVGGPLAAASFRLSAPSEAPPSPVAGQVAEALAKRGLRLSQGEAPADYVVEVAYADRPLAVAAAAPAGTVAPRQGRGPRTLFARAVADLTVRITETASGREIYRGEARLPHRRPLDDAGALVEAALSGLLSPPARAGPAG